MMANAHLSKGNIKDISLQRSKANAGLVTSADLQKAGRKIRETIESAVLTVVVAWGYQ